MTYYTAEEQRRLDAAEDRCLVAQGMERTIRAIASSLAEVEWRLEGFAADALDLRAPFAGEAAGAVRGAEAVRAIVGDLEKSATAHGRKLREEYFATFDEVHDTARKR